MATAQNAADNVQTSLGILSRPAIGAMQIARRSFLAMLSSACALLSSPVNTCIIIGTLGSLCAFPFTMYISDDVFIIGALFSALSWVALFSKATTWLVLGELRMIEQQNLKERLATIVLSKLLFLGAVLQPEIGEYVIWTLWFSVFTSFRLLVLLCRERCEYWTVSHQFSANRRRLICSILCVLVFCNSGILSAGTTIFGSAGFAVCSLMAFDAVMVYAKAIHVFLKYFWPMQEGLSVGSSSSSGTFMLDMAMEILILCIRMLYTVYVWSLNGSCFTLTDAMLFLNMRGIIYALFKRGVAYYTYSKLMADIERYPDATAAELERIDDCCGICLQPLEAAKGYHATTTFIRNACMIG